MADRKQLAILRKGVAGWNRWRGEDWEITPDLREADLREADLSGADLGGANLIRANLGGANLSGADLSGADLHSATVGYTVFGNVDLRDVKNLGAVGHFGPSTVGIDTIVRSEGQIPEEFLRGAGVPDTFITYIRSLVGTAIEFYSCFVSHSSQDHAFATRIHTDLQAQGVRCWFAPEDLKIGDRFRDRIDESIRLHEKLLLVLSRHSIASPWVRREVEAAFEREDREKRSVLFPVRIDDAIDETKESWASDIRRTRHIGDFRCWKEHDGYQTAFQRLLRDLQNADSRR